MNLAEFKTSSKDIIIPNNLDKTEGDYLFMDQSDTDGEDKTEFDDVTEDTKEVEYDELYMLPDNVYIFLIHKIMSFHLNKQYLRYM